MKKKTVFGVGAALVMALILGRCAATHSAVTITEPDAEPGIELGAELSAATEDLPAAAQAGEEIFGSPLRGFFRLTAHYGWRKNPISGVREHHPGIDLAAPEGTPVFPVLGGKIAGTRFNEKYGNYVIVNHVDGRQTLYAHVRETLVQEGQIVSQNDQIALVGSTGMSTGPHLHLSAAHDGRFIDPLLFLGKPWTDETPYDEEGYRIAAIYTVQQGDTLFSISDKYGYGISVDDLMAANGLPGDRVIKVGDALKIPVGK